MRYMLLIYTKEEAREAMTPPEAERIRNAHFAVMEDATRQGIFKGADPLEPTSVATTVRMKNGSVLTTDGPFAETKEQLAGYYILDCKDLDEAISWAARIASACGGGDWCIEIRPIREMSARVSAGQ